MAGGQMQRAGQLAVRVGGATAGASIVVAGAPPAVLGTATLIAATGGAAAVVLVGYGVYKLLSPKEDKA